MGEGGQSRTLEDGKIKIWIGRMGKTTIWVLAPEKDKKQADT